MEIPQEHHPLGTPAHQVGEAAPMQKPRRRKFAFLFLVVGLLAILIGSFAIAGRVPSDFIPGTVVVIPEKSSISASADILVRANVIRSKSAFEAILQTLFIKRPIMAGEYQFDKPADALEVAEIVTGGTFGRAQVKLTIPEGSSNADIAQIAVKSIPSFDAKSFLKSAAPYEGMLFPETYLVFKTIAPSDLISRMRKEFDKKISPFDGEIKRSGHSESDIVSMASILEREAKNASDAARIAGILWKRLSIGMPLQADAAPETYKRTGLPKPIGNPGVIMIQAALRPVPSEYLYYLYDKKGVIHYAKTYAGHQKNIQNYLR